MMRGSCDRSSRRMPGRSPRARAGRAAEVLLLALGASLACRRGERAGPRAAASPPPAVGETAPAAPVAEATPSIRQLPEPDRPPFAGLRAPRDAAVDGAGRVWIADFEHTAIRIFDSAGGYLGGWGTRGDGTYQLKDPCGIAIRGDEVYVADTWNGRVQRFSLAAAWRGRAPGDFYGPRGVAVAPDGRVWIADTGNNRVVVCEKDLSAPQAFGKKGDGPDQFQSPVGIAVGPSGRVYVADSVNRRLQVLDPDGRPRARFPFNGWGPNTEPYLEVDDRENVYASDPPGHAVVLLDRNGSERRRWTTDDAGRRFARPTGLALDARRRVLLVVNTDNDTVAALTIP